MTLENKPGLTDSAELARTEERISKKRAVELFESDSPDRIAVGTCFLRKYVEMNVAHPFREGNGRSMRIWLDMIFTGWKIYSF